MKRTTLDDIAQSAGISKMAVSLALRGSSRVAEATRKRVADLAQKMNYQPDPAVSRLAANRWKEQTGDRHETIAYLGYEQQLVDWIDTYLLQGVRERAHAHGYTVLSHIVKPGTNPKRLAEKLWKQGITGLICGYIPANSFVESFPWQQFAVTHCMMGPTLVNGHYILPNHASCARIAWEHAVASGATRIGVVLLDKTNPVDEIQRTGGHYYCQQVCYPHLPKLPLCRLPPDENVHVDILVRWVLHNKPEVILGFNDYIYWLLIRAGISIPGQVKFIDLYSTRKARKEIASLDTRPTLIGQRAVDLVDTLLRRRVHSVDQSDTIMMVDPVWSAGASLPERTNARSPN
ncbi:MAG: LacI family DNA-binding transcriptional regulator [Verrucomicrobiota bacterium]|nr:LacI family DNA-binding transcriptional regulator [Verrucomicrobiota bacterium]